MKGHRKSWHGTVHMEIEDEKRKRKENKTKQKRKKNKKTCITWSSGGRVGS